MKALRDGDVHAVSVKVSRQLSIVLRCPMKRQCFYRCKFQCHCLIELLCPCVVTGFVGEGFHIG
ncbi:DUF3709 domain-containing protein [Vibrio cholerae]|uniref:DUF3709 domain-containing protein n=1 Tax=Vibrio cholerae TaxID=666 RepID=UPI0011DC3245|nr:DUF3709 domain-containing protein [Vibrio cholerae]NOE60760.1 DUF3709 domain-containing protein [Vibrio cholerae]TXY36856.1 DUF3709 domain-containing protein [Vibrio cholerae]